MFSQVYFVLYSRLLGLYARYFGFVVKFEVFDAIRMARAFAQLVN